MIPSRVFNPPDVTALLLIAALLQDGAR